jgi:Domain of unknown function (DUF4263)
MTEAASRFVMAPEPDSDSARPAPMDWQKYSDAVLAQWFALLQNDPEEADVHAFLEVHPSMVPGGSGDIGPGGHHRSEMGAVFSKPELKGSGRSFIPDFMWVTRSSGLVTPILVEIEKPSKRWFKRDGRPTADFRDAHDQLNDWRSWFKRDANKAIFRDNYLFNDRYTDRPLEPQFVLVYGREAEFTWAGSTNPDEMRHKRESQRAEAETFITFDSLRPRYDHRLSVTVTKSAGQGLRPLAFSPVYQTDTDTGEDAKILGDATEALDRSVMMTQERREYLKGRWNFWWDDERRRDQSKTYMRSSGLE